MAPHPTQKGPGLTTELSVSPLALGLAYTKRKTRPNNWTDVALPDLMYTWHPTMPRHQLPVIHIP
jgi:hypothetical protein